MAEANNRSRQRQKKRGKGRQPVAKVGDYESLINKLHQEIDVFDVEVANALEGFYEDMIKMAKGELTLSKDQIKIIEMCIKRAETILDEHYQDGGDSDSGEEESVVEENAPLIDTKFLKAVN